MKKFILTISIILAAAVAAGAQSMKEATEKAQNANAALQAGNLTEALEGFTSALAMANACGDEGVELTGTCKGAINQIKYSLAKQAFDNGDYDDAIVKAEDAKKTALEFEDDEFAGRNEGVINNAYTKKAIGLMNEKNFDGAADIYRKLLEINPSNGGASLNLVRACVAGGKLDEARAAFVIAKENGKEAEAAKLLGTACLKNAAAKLQAKDYAGAVEAANEANSYNENAKAYLVAGQASQKSGKDAAAIEYFSKYLELAPNDKSAAAIAFTVGALYQKAGNKASAAKYYQMTVNDPKFGEQAKNALNSLK